MKKFKTLAILLVVALILPFVTVNTANAEDDSSRPYTKDSTYEYDSIPSRHLYSDDLYNLKFTVDEKEFSLNTNESIGKLSYMYCDSYGTCWINLNAHGLYFYSYELQGDDFVFYFYDDGQINVDDSEYAFAVEYYKNGQVNPLPSTEELKAFLDSNTLTALPIADVTPTDSASTTPSTTPTVAPSDVPSVAPSTVPTVTPIISPNAVPSTVPTVAPNETQATEETVTFSKVTTSGNKLKLVDSNGTVSKTATFNKKKATLSSSGVKVKSVKAACYTKKGTLVYLKKNGKAYYLVGKKSKLIAKNVSSIKKDSKGFAVKLVTKSGKKIILSK